MGLTGLKQRQSKIKRSYANSDFKELRFATPKIKPAWTVNGEYDIRCSSQCRDKVISLPKPHSHQIKHVLLNKF